MSAWNALPMLDRRITWLGWASIATILLTQALAILLSPADRGMGHTQKIMYIHVPSAWGAFLCLTIVFVCSVLYLWKREERFDRVAHGATEAAAVLTAMTLLQGSIWGRPTWGVWWTWDPRLTTTAMLLAIAGGSLALRALTDDREKAATWCAAVGILGFLDVPIVYMSVRWWRTLHQPQSGSGTLAPIYRLMLVLNVVAFTAVVIWCIARRVEAARLQARADALQEDRLLRADRRR